MRSFVKHYHTSQNTAGQRSQPGPGRGLSNDDGHKSFPEGEVHVHDGPGNKSQGVTNKQSGNDNTQRNIRSNCPTSVYKSFISYPYYYTDV